MSAVTPKFTAGQKQILREAGLFAEQITKLESRLPICRSILEPSAPRNEVRDKLDKLQSSLRKTQKALTEIMSGSSLAFKEAQVRMQAAEFDVYADHFDPDDALVRSLGIITATLTVVTRAMKDLPTEQRRNRISGSFPIQQIARALDIEVSLTKKPFPAVATVFYDALGYKDKDLQRPIKNYLKLQRARRPAQPQ